MQLPRGRQCGLKFLTALSGRNNQVAHICDIAEPTKQGEYEGLVDVGGQQILELLRQVFIVQKTVGVAAAAQVDADRSVAVAGQIRVAVGISPRLSLVMTRAFSSWIVRTHV